MNKIYALILTLCLLFLTGCSTAKTTINSTSFVQKSESSSPADFSEIKEHYNQILSLLTDKSNELKDSHNEQIEKENPDNYIYDTGYIFTSFNFFSSDTSFGITDKFNDRVDSENAKLEFSSEASGREVSFEKSDTSYTLTFVSEDITEKYSVKFNTSNESFTYTYYQETPSGENLIDFLEFKRTGQGSYSIQNKSERCSVEIPDNSVVSFYYSSMISDTYYETDSIFETSSFGKSWVNEKSSSGMKFSIEYDDSEMTYKDYSGGVTADKVVMNG